MLENILQVFDNSEYGQIRFILIDNKPYAVGVDIAKALGYSNPSKAVIQHCKAITKTGIPSNSGTQITNVIPQGDILRLAAKCKIAGADKFESWIFDEVLPTILNTGSYDKLEESILSIEDEGEKELSLGLYSIQKALKNNPNDITLSLLEKQKYLELEQYTSNKRLNEIEDNVANIKNLIELKPNENWKKETNEILNAIGFQIKDYKEARTIAYDLLRERTHCNLNIRVINLKNRLKAQGYSTSQLNNISKLDIIERDEKLKLIYIQIVREMAIKYEINLNKSIS